MKSAWLCALTVLLSALLVSAPARSAGDFALIDQHGQFHQLSRYGEYRAVVLLVQRNGDARSRAAEGVLAGLRQQFQDQPLVFLMLNADRDVSRGDVLAEAVDFPVLLDSAQIVALSMGLERVADVVVLNPRSQRVLYRSGLHSGEALEAALTAVLDEADIAAENQQSAGPVIDFYYQRQFEQHGVSYAQDIAPLLQRRCAHCHIEDGLAPWAMNRHLMVMGWSPMIRETVITRRMPPGQLDGEVGDWQATHELTPAEQALLVHWIDAGAPQDGDHDPLLDGPSVPERWPLGEPDLIVELPEEQVPATGVIDFRLKQVQLDLNEDRWLRAVAYDVGDRSVLHSLLVYALDRGGETVDGADLIDPAMADFFSIYVPGEEHEVFPDNAGFLLCADRDLSFKLRYTSSGRATVDRTRIGLYFHDEPPDLALRSEVIFGNVLEIPPNVDNHVEEAETPPVDSGVLLTGFSPHAHNRAKSMRIFTVDPDGERQLLANVANYNFNWQLAYNLQQPLALPPGSRLMAETVYDNTFANPHNPDPDQSVQWGVSVDDEMFSHYVRLLQSRESTDPQQQCRAPGREGS